jgi:hypothetical protein
MISSSAPAEDTNVGFEVPTAVIMKFYLLGYNLLHVGFFILNMEATYSSEKCVIFERTTRRYIP